MADLRLRLRAALLAAALPFAALGAAPSPGSLPDLGPRVAIGRLPAGGTYIVHMTTGAPVAAVELWYRAPSTGFGPKPAPSIARLAAQVVAASKPLIGQSLGQQVQDLGGRLSIAAYSDSVSISAVVPADAARAIVRVMTTAFFAPVITEDGFKQAQQDLAQEAFGESFDPETVVRDSVFEQLFSAGPQHYPALDPRGVGGLTIDDVRGFATRAFRSQNAYLVVSGSVASGVTDAVATGRPSSDGVEPPSVPVLATSPLPVDRAFVEPSGGYGWIGPPISDERAATALDFLADYLFRPMAGVVAREVDREHPDTLVTGQFITLHDPGVMLIVFSGKSSTAVRSLVDDALATARKPMDSATFGAALSAFEDHLYSDLQTPSQSADNFGWYAVEGNLAYAPGAGGDAGPYLKAVSTLTPEFVASVAEQYLGKTPVVVTMQPRKKMSAP